MSSKEKGCKVISWIPIYKRKPNTFIRYIEEDKGDYMERIAEYKNKAGELCEMTAQVLWKK